MSPRHKHRLYFVGILMVASALIAFLIIKALNQNIHLFYTPSQINAGNAPFGLRVRLGGMVKIGSVMRDRNLNNAFSVTDYKTNILVQYQGILPDLFKEGQGVVAYGRWQNNQVFVADEILAKHDENYMPKEVQMTVQQQGAP